MGIGFVITMSHFLQRKFKLRFDLITASNMSEQTDGGEVRTHTRGATNINQELL
jgi:hypothetical protein